MSFGLGKQVTKRYSVAGMYGVVPALSHGPIIETFTLRQNYMFTTNERINFYAGLNIFHVTGIRYHTSEYGEAPEEYYPIGSVRGLAYLGLTLAMGKRQRTAFYVEAGLNDIWIVNWVSNYGEINPVNYVSLALGFRHQFN